jgi:hypothetical protein
MGTGAWPAAEIDHVNGDPADNRLKNLRESTHAESGQNRPRRSVSNTSGLSGVNWHKQARKWRARIGVGGRRYSLGVFADRGAAIAVYLQAKERFHLFHPVPREETSARAAVGALKKGRPRASAPDP